jgi:glycosyl transferase family 25
MLHLISKNNCLKDYYFIHDGDLETISQDILANVFGGKLASLSPAVSCAYKHILAYYEVLKSNQGDYSLILEDDIYLNENFCTSLNNILSELKQRKLENVIVSLEESSLKYVKGSERKKNVLLYKKSKGRMAGAYLIDTHSAKSMVTEIEQNKCNYPIDWFHNYCSDKGLIDIYWAHPPVSVQGSLNGKIKSLIDDKPVGKIKIIKFMMSRFYKRLLYRIR